MYIIINARMCGCAFTLKVHTGCERLQAIRDLACAPRKGDGTSRTAPALYAEPSALHCPTARYPSLPGSPPSPASLVAPGGTSSSGTLLRILSTVPIAHRGSGPRVRRLRARRARFHASFILPLPCRPLPPPSRRLPANAGSGRRAPATESSNILISQAGSTRPVARGARIQHGVGPGKTGGWAPGPIAAAAPAGSRAPGPLGGSGVAALSSTLPFLAGLWARAATEV